LKRATQNPEASKNDSNDSENGGPFRFANGKSWWGLFYTGNKPFFQPNLKRLAESANFTED